MIKSIIVTITSTLSIITVMTIIKKTNINEKPNSICVSK